MWLITLKFHFSAANYPHLGIAYRPNNPNKKATINGDSSGGVMLRDRVENSSLFQMVKELDADYALVDAFYEPAPEKKFSSGGYIATYVFCARPHAQPSVQFVQHRKEILKSLRAFCRSALWTVRIYSNPCYIGGELIPDAYTATVNCVGRVPVLDDAGAPVMVWPRNAAGNPMKFGAKVPLMPDYLLRLVPRVPELLAAD
jgi:hypothetical protein